MCSLARARVRLPFLVLTEPRTPLPPGERGQGQLSSCPAARAWHLHRRVLQAEGSTRLRRSTREARVLVVDRGQHAISTRSLIEQIPQWGRFSSPHLFICQLL